MKINSALITAFALGAGLCTAYAVSVMQREVVQGADQFEFTYRVKLPALDKPAQLWLPLARSDKFQTVKVESISSPLKYEQVRDRDYSNQILVLSPTAADSGKVIEIKYGVKRLEKSAYDSKAADPIRYLKPERLVPVNETFKSLADDATRGKATVNAKARALYDHTLGKMTYDKSQPGWGRGDAVWACDARTGNCTDFHAYFIALARSVNIPARFAIGYTIPADKDEGAIAGYHCWAEFCADGKWVPVDISEAS
ncbi:MAG: transglutaminase domain-containing protein, partial [Verrucomicrobia bacterium]|nr:transglutaminase domain-containing protein [Verrucomicrobiota bacterium]